MGVVEVVVTDAAGVTGAEGAGEGVDFFLAMGGGVTAVTEEEEGTEEIRNPWAFFLVVEEEEVVLEEEEFKIRVEFEGFLVKGKFDLRVAEVVGEGFFLIGRGGGCITILLTPMNIPVFGAQLKYLLLLKSKIIPSVYIQRLCLLFFYPCTLPSFLPSPCLSSSIPAQIPDLKSGSPT